jgi:methylthioribose-1-phosphate isomerase
MRTRAYGQVVAFLYSVILAARSGAVDLRSPESLRTSLAHVAAKFTEARPTFGFSGIADLLLQRCGDWSQTGNAQRWLEERIHGFVDEIDHARKHRARHAADLLPDPCCLLTHCNLSGELVVVANRCREIGKTLQVIATETRPYLQGSRLTAWEVSNAGIEVMLIPDNAVAQVMAEGKVNAVLVGADRVARNGDVINKVGTYPLALIAKDYHVPVLALVQDPGSLQNGDELEIEERPVSELFDMADDPVSFAGLDGRYPAFDITPAALLSRLVGFREAWTPPAFANAYGGVPGGTKQSIGARDRKFHLLFGIPCEAAYERIRREAQSGNFQSLLLPEMRPELLGATQISVELVRRGVPATLISDNMAGIFFYRGEIDRVYLCYERREAGHIISRSGGRLMANLARLHGVAIDYLPAGERVVEVRDTDVGTFLGRRVSPAGVRVYAGREDSIPF